MAFSPLPTPSSPTPTGLEVFCGEGGCLVTGVTELALPESPWWKEWNVCV